MPPRSRSRSPRRKSKSRRSPGRRYSRSPKSRSMRQVRSALEEVDWSGRGASNTLAVQKSVEAANQMGIPANREHLARLQKFSTQVLKMEYPSCPLSWERHTRSVKDVEDKYGVVWTDQDGYFCAPPGSSPDTLVPDPEEYKSPVNLRKEINELTRDIKYALDPAAKAAADKITSEIDSKRLTALAKMTDAQSSAHQKKLAKMEAEKTKKENKHIELLTKIYSKYDTSLTNVPNRLDVAKSSATQLMETANRCLFDGGGIGCESITVGVGKDQRTIYVPGSIMSSDNEAYSPLKGNLQEWWRRYRKVSEELIKARKHASESRYI